MKRKRFLSAIGDLPESELVACRWDREPHLENDHGTIYGGCWDAQRVVCTCDYRRGVTNGRCVECGKDA